MNVIARAENKEDDTPIGKVAIAFPLNLIADLPSQHAGLPAHCPSNPMLHGGNPRCARISLTIASVFRRLEASDCAIMPWLNPFCAA
jgi:hypothetical protein